MTIRSVPLTHESLIRAVPRLTTEPSAGDPEPDVSLIQRLQSGDESALEPLFRRHAPMLVALAARITGSVEDGRDVVQDVFAGLAFAA